MLIDEAGEPTLNANFDGDTSYARADFEGSGNQGKYTALGWDFSPGTGDWKWLPGYDYPVLRWQTRPPLDPASL
jgi:hypothetical protein